MEKPRTALTQNLPKSDELYKMSIIVNIDGSLHERVHYFKVGYVPGEITGTYWTDKIILRNVIVRNKFYTLGQNILGIYPVDFPLMLNPGDYRISRLKQGQNRIPDLKDHPCEMVVFTPQEFRDGKFIPIDPIT